MTDQPTAPQPWDTLPDDPAAEDGPCIEVIDDCVYLWLSFNDRIEQGQDVTDHFAGGPLPEVGDTAWVVKP